MTQSLHGKSLLVVGAGSGIGRALAIAASKAGASLILAGRNCSALEETRRSLVGQAQTVELDLTDQSSITSACERIESVHYLAFTAALPANGPISSLKYADIVAAFDVKVIGPLMLVKALQASLLPDASILLFSGITAWRPSPGRTVMATTNGAVATLVAAMAVELGPIRVNGISPGIVDSGLWDGLGEGKAQFLEKVAASNPSQCVGEPAHVVSAALAVLTNPFITGTTLHIDGGGRLA